MNQPIGGTDSTYPIGGLKVYLCSLYTGAVLFYVRHRDSRWYIFWENLKEGYDYFEMNGKVPNVEVRNNRYVFE